jgi:hypothetical protein
MTFSFAERYNDTIQSKAILDVQTLFKINKTDADNSTLSYSLKKKGCDETYNGEIMEINENFEVEAKVNLLTE